MSEKVKESGTWPTTSIPPTWLWASFDTCFLNVTDANRKIKTTDYRPEGCYPVIDQGAEYISGYCDDADLVNPSSPPTIIFGDHTRCVKYVTFPFVQGADGTKVLSPIVIAPRFAYWALRALRLPDKGYSRHFRFLKASKFPIPPINEQHRIVAKIEELFSDLDAGVTALERVKANLKRYRASVLKAAVEGRLTKRWRTEHPDTEPADRLLERILTERRRKWEADQLVKYEAKGKKPPKGWKDKYKEPAKPDTSKLPKLPEGWCWTNVDQLVEVGTGTTPRRGHGPYWDGGNIPWITSTAVNGLFIHEANDSVTERALAETNLTIYPKHTLLLALYGEGKTRGKVSELMIAATINQALGALQFDSISASCRDYLKLFLQSNYDKMRRGSAGGVQPNLNLGLVRQITVPLPPADEQLAIVQVASEELSKAESVAGSCSDDLRRAARLRQSILKRAFEGKLVPQDTADEPAQALLARIAEHRAKAAPKRQKPNHSKVSS